MQDITEKIETTQTHTVFENIKNRLAQIGFNQGKEIHVKILFGKDEQITAKVRFLIGRKKIGEEKFNKRFTTVVALLNTLFPNLGLTIKNQNTEIFFDLKKCLPK